MLAAANEIMFTGVGYVKAARPTFLPQLLQYAYQVFFSSQ